MADTMSTPLSTAWPSRAMNPTAAATESGMRASIRPMTPPISAKGTLSSTIRQSATDPNSEKSSTKVMSRASGMTRRRRAMARSWFSNSPPQSTSYPGGSPAAAATFSRASRTKEPMSRLRTFMRTPT